MLGEHHIAAVGHRVVHGGTRFSKPVLIDATTLAELVTLIPLAPLHQPHNLAAIGAVAQRAPAWLMQVACFDTAFHLPAVAQAFALPRGYAEQGVRRYGFHGRRTNTSPPYFRARLLAPLRAAPSSPTSAMARACVHWRRGEALPRP